LRSEVPWLKRPPSAYVIDHVRLTTQPLDEPESRQHLAQLLEMFPADRMLMFSTDYPHWDFDNPTVITDRLPAPLKDRVMFETAAELYGLPSLGTGS
jgi:predicted TIM-barrel fold metal-dependent hydrolase